MFKYMRYLDFYSSSMDFHMISPSAFPNSIDRHDTGLSGVQGAEAILELLRVERPVSHLILGHNSLGDTGCVALFDYLRSEEGERHEILEINLNENQIGDAGLWAIARYLEYNKSLSVLFLQNNNFKGDRPIMLRFALAVNRSNLRTLSLTCNKSLADAIATAFLPNLSSPKLTELHLSVCLLGPSATPALLSYLTSPRSYALFNLKLTGNPLGLSSVTHIVQELERANWSLGWAEMKPYRVNGDGQWVQGCWKCDEHLRFGVLHRNRYLGRRSAADAIFLLIHARPALVAYGRQGTGARARLPPELVIHILSFLAPTLSSAQHVRVCTFAASLSTLPSLGLTLPSPLHSTPLPSSSPKNGKWLQKVGCDRFEPDVEVPIPDESIKLSRLYATIDYQVEQVQKNQI
ncbi:hypothetical protein JB92DRAFT_2795177 [Gautieria morchelliformis]|nr:hypothetical protein JB92DRAFT_2795177 [Gautieria morchelliformis]